MDSISINTRFDHLFRHSYGRLVATLVNKFGFNHIESIEDSVQEALIKGMQVWAYKSVPEDPTAWLLTVAKNKMLDINRRNKQLTTITDNINESIYVQKPSVLYLDHTIIDDQLRMIFACCHPNLTQENQIILTLKLVAGFHNREVARALLKNEETVAKAFTRAKKKFRDSNLSLSIPFEIGLSSRLNIVLKTIYLLFSEGYAASSGEEPIKRDLCFEAIRLALLLRENKFCDRPNLNALIALMCFHTSRFDARINANGEFVDLENQDRNLWDQELITIGRTYLSKATQGPEQPTDYLFQAFISYYHCTAKSFEATDWQSILSLYDLKLKHAYTPLIELNRMVPYYQIHGAEKTFNLLQIYSRKDHAILDSLYYALKAQLLTDMNKIEDAIECYDKAIILAKNETERRHLNHKKNSL